MGDLIRIGYYNSPIPIDRPRISRYRLQSLQAHACTLRVLSHSSPLTASLFLCVERSCRCSGIHLAKYKQEAYIAFCISRRPNSNNQTNYVCIGEVIQSEQQLRNFLLFVYFALNKKNRNRFFRIIQKHFIWLYRTVI